MTSYLCLSLRFLDSAFHGRLDSSTLEWPPSPLRVFQSLVGAAARCNRGEMDGQTRNALLWMERQPAPAIVTPTGLQGAGYRLSVPNNQMDIVARAWCRGNESNSGDANPAKHRTMKSVRPMLLLGEAVHYLWEIPNPITDEIRGHADALRQTAANVVALGWGVDLVVGHGAIVSSEQAKALAGERWLPQETSGDTGLRTPVPQTLEDVLSRYRLSLRRIGPDGFIPPPPLAVYRRIEYRREGDPPVRSVAAFSLLDSEANRAVAFDTARCALTVAGMMRHATQTAADRNGWPDSAFILGHGEASVDGGHAAVGPRRFAYLPLPTIESRRGSDHRVVGSIRRVMLTAYTSGCEQEIAWARRCLPGEDLVRTDEQRVAMLALVPANDFVVRCYTQAASAWTTVTPVVLPGYDDPRHYRRRLQRQTDADEQKDLLARLDHRVDGLLRKAIAQAGFPEPLAEHARIEWRKAGFRAGNDLADRYGVPDHLKRFPRYHVRLEWRDASGHTVEVPGPVCLGGGRFYGVGLFAVA